MLHVMTIQAGEHKNGTGYIGIVKIHSNEERRVSSIFETEEKAIFWAQQEAHKIMGGKNYRRAAYQRRYTPRGRYVANIFEV